MGFLHLVKEEDPPIMGFQDLPKATRHPSLIAKEELHTVEMLKLRHIEPVERPLSEKIPGTFKGQFSFPDAGRSKEQEGTQRLVRGLKAQFSAFQDRTDSRNDMALSLDPGGKVSLQAGEFLDEGGIGNHERDGDGDGSED